MGLRALFAGLSIDAKSQVYTPGFNATLGRVTQLVTIHDLIHLQSSDETSMSKKLYYEKIIRPAIFRAGVVHTVSEYSKSQIENWLGSKNVSVVNVGNGVSNVFYREGRIAPTELNPRFVYVGNLKSHKNARVIFDALRLRPNYSVDFVTSGRNEVTQRAIASGVESQVTSISGISDIDLAGLYERSSGLLFPSLLEGFGLPPLEALMAGTPVAYSRECSAVAEVVGQAGYAVDDSGSPSGWAQGMDYLVESRQIVPDEVRAGLRSKYSWDGVGERVQESLNEWVRK